MSWSQLLRWCSVLAQPAQHDLIRGTSDEVQAGVWPLTCDDGDQLVLLVIADVCALVQQGLPAHVRGHGLRRPAQGREEYEARCWGSKRQAAALCPHTLSTHLLLVDYI